jgi:rhamnose utilization protein RhaD (predicted bifunctional aldolase and dehydrogenase)
MRSKWVEADAAEFVARGAQVGIAPELSLRIYSTRLLGAEPKLVLHGGGNTSLKTRERDLLGTEIETLRIKASGFDMAAIGPEGLPAVRLAPLRALRTLETIADAKLVAIERANLIDPMAPNPSVEVMLHAFLPQTFVDHTHASAVLSIVDQPDGEKKCADAFGDRLAFVPYLMPGFGLAKTTIEVFERLRPSAGLVLGKHGVVTFGDGAREAYERMIEAVSIAEDFIARNSRPRIAATTRRQVALVEAAAPIVRGACSQKDETNEGAWRRLVLDFRGGEKILSALQTDLSALSRAGVVTPDHVIRTKSRPLVLPHPAADALDDFAQATRAAAATFATSSGLATARMRSIPCPAWCWCRVLVCSAWATPSTTPQSPRTSPKNGSRLSPTRSVSAASSRFPRPRCSIANTGRWSRQSSARTRRGRWVVTSSPSPALPAPLAPQPPRPSRRLGPKLRCSI